MTRRRAWVQVGLVAAWVACASSSDPPPTSATPRASALEAALLALPGASDPAEARSLAQEALVATAELSRRYRPLRPPHLGNLAFHVGLRERALCCHWVEDLLRALEGVELRHYELHWVVAHHGSRLREHSAVLVLPIGGAPAEGLILDAWRHSGRLYWARVDSDSYPWHVHPSDPQRSQLRCS